MNITQKDFNETSKLMGLLAKIDNLDTEYVNEISDETFKQQPFFLTVLLGYHLDTSPEELEEIMKIYFLIWEYFKQNKNIPKKRVTETYFDKIQNRNIQMLKYVEGEHEEDERLKIYSNDLQNLKSKALFTAILYRYINRPVLKKMGKEKKGIILVGIKSFIEYFETA